MAQEFEEDLLEELVRGETRYCADWKAVQENTRISDSEKTKLFFQILSEAVIPALKKGVHAWLATLEIELKQHPLENLCTHITEQLATDSNKLGFWMRASSSRRNPCILRTVPLIHNTPLTFAEKRSLSILTQHFRFKIGVLEARGRSIEDSDDED